MNPAAINLFFLGKGGVGKSTVSALTALALAEKGLKVLLASMDPAHNQSDIFETPLSEKTLKFNPHLWLKEIEIEQWIKKYLKDVQGQIRKSYNYLSALNLEHYFDIIKFSPGIEEYGLLLAYENICEEFKHYNYIIFDMPPTALALKFFSLPGLSLQWLNKLLELRQEIIKKREIISRIKFGKKEIEQDKILDKLNTQITQYGKMKSVFTNQQKTRVNLVLNPDKLSLSESLLIRQRLKEQGIDLNELILNKFNNENLSHLQDSFLELKIIKLPPSSEPLIGEANLTEYLQALPAAYCNASVV